MLLPKILKKYVFGTKSEAMHHFRSQVRFSEFYSILTRCHGSKNYFTFPYFHYLMKHVQRSISVIDHFLIVILVSEICGFKDTNLFILLNLCRLTPSPSISKSGGVIKKLSTAKLENVKFFIKYTKMFFEIRQFSMLNHVIWRFSNLPSIFCAPNLHFQVLCSLLLPIVHFFPFHFLNVSTKKKLNPTPVK